MSAPKKSTRGGARPGAGRKPAHGTPGVMLPWRVPPAAKERVLAHAAASGRTPGQVLVDAVEALPATLSAGK